VIYVYVHVVREEAEPDSRILGFPLGVEPKDVITKQIGTLNRIFKPVGKRIFVGSIIGVGWLIRTHNLACLIVIS
jgi:hypothetical protein